MKQHAAMLAVAVLLSSVVMDSGCTPSMTIEEMKAMMPNRPVELDQLNAFVGTWDHTGFATMAGLGEPVATTCESEVRWEGDGWYMVDGATCTMAGFDAVGMNAVWAYDSRARVFRTNWVDAMGSFGVGTMRYDKKTDTWHMEGRSYKPFGTVTGKGTVKFLAADTREWVWTEYAMGGLIKTMEMRSMAKRRR